MRLSVRVEVDVPTSPHFTEDELAQKLADVAAQALREQMSLVVLHAASVRRRGI